MLTQSRLVLAALVVLSGCKIDKTNANLSNQESIGLSQSATLAVSEGIPDELQTFVEVVAGKSKRMHDQYFSNVLPNNLKDRVKISKDVVMQYTKDLKTERGSIPMKVNDTYRGVVIGDRVLVFQKKTESGGPAESGPWWYPVKSYPMSLLVDKSLEERIRSGLNTEIYEKREIGKVMEELDAIEFGLNFVPMYGGAKDYFYDGKTSGLVWMIGDAASLGMAAKIKAVANTSRAVVIAASTVRIGNGIVQASQGQATLGTGADVALATLEGSLAAVGFINIKFNLRSSVKASNLDEIVDGLDESRRVLAADRASAELMAKKLGKEIDDVLTNGITREEFAKIANRALKEGEEVVDSAALLARRIPEHAHLVSDSSIDNLLKRPFQGKISDSEIAAIQKKMAEGEYPTPLEMQKLLTVSTPSKPTAFVNVTQNETIEKVLESDGLYWGYVGFINLPKGIYATAKPIAWNAMDMINTAGKGGTSGRDSMIVFIGDAAKEFGLVRSEGILGKGLAFSKTVLKRNAEYATNKGDILFKDFKLFSDGQKNMLVVSKVEMPGTLHTSLPGSSAYKKLVRIKPTAFAVAVVNDVATGVIVIAGPPAVLVSGFAGGLVFGDFLFGTSTADPGN